MECADTALDKFRYFARNPVSPSQKWLKRMGEYMCTSCILCAVFCGNGPLSAGVAVEEAKQSLASLGRNQKAFPAHHDPGDPFALNSTVASPNPSDAYASPERGVQFGTGGRRHLPPDDPLQDLNAPVAHQPFYYRRLPSVRNPVSRNVFLPIASPPPPVKDYIPHTGYATGQMTLGVPSVTVGQSNAFSVGFLNSFPAGPYDATQSVEERGAILRMRRHQQDLQKSLLVPPTVGASLVASR